MVSAVSAVTVVTVSAADVAVVDSVAEGGAASVDALDVGWLRWVGSDGVHDEKNVEAATKLSLSALRMVASNMTFTFLRLFWYSVA